MRDNGVSGVHGRVIDLMDCNAELYRAAEVTAGGRMSDDVMQSCTGRQRAQRVGEGGRGHSGCEGGEQPKQVA